MPMFTVNVKEVHIQPYEVEAKSATEAVNKIREGDGDILGDTMIEGGFEYSHTLDCDEWTVEDEQGNRVSFDKEIA